MKDCLSLYSEFDGLYASQVFLNRWMGLICTSAVLSRRGQQEEMEIRELHLVVHGSFSKICILSPNYKKTCN